MPDYFSHQICAQTIFEDVAAEQRKKITDKNLYLLGAQGPDVFFMYNILPTANNAGRTIHHMSALQVFKALSVGSLSYAAGFATHYALDCTLHPAVYAYQSNHKTFLSHLKFESDLGLYISKRLQMRRTILPKQTILSCTGQIYDNLKLLIPSVTLTGTERCLKRYVNYTKGVFRSKKQTYGCDYEFSALDDKIEQALSLGKQALSCVLDKNIDSEIFSKSFLER